jgi:hypothetical protein
MVRKIQADNPVLTPKIIMISDLQDVVIDSVATARCSQLSIGRLVGRLHGIQVISKHKVP